MDQQVSSAGGAQNRTSVERRGDRELVVTRTFNAPPSTVYKAWSRPELFQRWWVPKSLAGVSLDDGPGVARVARTMPVHFRGDRILLGSSDVSDAIRTEAAGMAASRVSAHPEVRAALLELQHSFRKLPGLVADGRDMGTVIFPNAPLKVFLTASALHRAERRHKQLISKGNSVTIAEIQQDLEARDARDSSRKAAPLKPADDAKPLDNSYLSIEKSVDQVIEWWQSTRPF